MLGTESDLLTLTQSLSFLGISSFPALAAKPSSFSGARNALQVSQLSHLLLHTKLWERSPKAEALQLKGDGGNAMPSVSCYVTAILYLTLLCVSQRPGAMFGPNIPVCLGEALP